MTHKQRRRERTLAEESPAVLSTSTRQTRWPRVVGQRLVLPATYRSDCMAPRSSNPCYIDLLLPITPSMASNVGDHASCLLHAGSRAGHGQLRQARPTRLPPQPDRPVTSLTITGPRNIGAYLHKACSPPPAPSNPAHRLDTQLRFTYLFKPLTYTVACGLPTSPSCQHPYIRLRHPDSVRISPTCQIRRFGNTNQLRP